MENRITNTNTKSDSVCNGPNANCLQLFATLLRVFGKRSRTCLEIESKYNLLQIKKKRKKDIIWSDLFRLLGMVNLAQKREKIACEHCVCRILIDSKNHSSIKCSDCCLKLLKRKSYMRASLFFPIAFIPNLRYYFPTFCCFCASCIEMVLSG